MDEQTSNRKAAPIERAEDFTAYYANNARFEPTVYDLTIVFGQSDLGSGKEVIRQHTSITIPWALVKLAKYFLEVNLLIHETENGKVNVPPNQIPEPLPEPAEEIISSPPSMSAFQSIKKLREDFIANL